MDIYRTIDSVIRKESQAVLDVLDYLKKENAEKAVKVISECRGKVIFSGCGTSGAAGKKITHTFNCVGRPALFLVPSDAVHGGLGVVQSDDVIILLSRGGATAEINNLIAPCKAKKAFVIGVTEDEHSVLAKESDLLLKVQVKAEADPTGLLATSSIMGLIAVFDAIAICLAEIIGFSAEKFSVIHPGGAVGEKLLHRNLY